MNVEVFCFDAGRSREGAWIEILMPCYGVVVIYGRSREGAWIEIVNTLLISQISSGSLP